MTYETSMRFENCEETLVYLTRKTYDCHLDEKKSKRSLFARQIWKTPTTELFLKKVVFLQYYLQRFKLSSCQYAFYFCRS